MFVDDYGKDEESCQCPSHHLAATTHDQLALKELRLVNKDKVATFIDMVSPPPLLLDAAPIATPFICAIRFPARSKKGFSKRNSGGRGRGQQQQCAHSPIGPWICFNPWPAQGWLGQWLGQRPFLGWVLGQPGLAWWPEPPWFQPDVDPGLQPLG